MCMNKIAPISATLLPESCGFLFQRILSKALILLLKEALENAIRKNNEKTAEVERLRMEGDALEREVAALRLVALQILPLNVLKGCSCNTDR